MKHFVIITAGGSGLRMGADIPKQFLDLNGEPILRRTVDLFLSLPFEVTVIIAMNSIHNDWWFDYCQKKDFFFPHFETQGGITRFHSVKNALKYVTEDGLVAVHDGVRPLVSKEQIIRLYELAESHPAVIPALPVTDSMRVEENGILKIIDRSIFRTVQTPQVFQSDVLLDSYHTDYNDTFTDDASVVEAKGHPLFFCEGEKYNIKITTKEDLLVARAIFGREIMNPDLPFESLVK